MPVIHLIKPPYIVDAGPCCGVYADKEAYEQHLASKGIQGFCLHTEVKAAFGSVVVFPHPPENLSAGKKGFIIKVGENHFIKRTARFGPFYGKIILTEDRAQAQVWSRERDALRKWAVITHRQAHGEKLPPGALEVEPE